MKFIPLIVCLFALSAHADLITPLVSPSPVVLNTAQKQAALKYEIQRMVTNRYLALKQTYTALNELMWDNPSGLTPQQAFAALGADQCSLRKMGLGVAALLNGAKAGTVPTEEMHLSSTMTPSNGAGADCVVTAVP